MDQRDPVKAILERHGIKDPESYLLNEGANPKIIPSRDPAIQPRGSVFMMLRRFIDMDTISTRLAALKRA